MKTLEENPDEKPIVFCYFTKEIEYLTQKLKEKEISYKIGFEDPTNFVKYFKKYTELTPIDFRKKY